MATAEQLKALIKSYGEADGERFISVATQIAAQAARSGKSRLASDLKSLIDEIRHLQKSARVGGAVPIARPKGDLASILTVTYPQTRLAEMVLSQPQQAAIHRTLSEYRQQSKLREFALSARRKLLFVGPPGCGKTMTSHAIAGELKMPHFAVQLHALITKFMGETAAKLHMIFEAMAETRGVYLFDEFDAIGGDRNARNDVGEVRRILNSFLQFLEQDQSDSLIVAATNNESLLDYALFRRFDEIVRYEKPRKDAITELIQNRLAPFDHTQLELSYLAEKAVGLSHAEVCRACDDAAKQAVLNGNKCISNSALDAALVERSSNRF